ncbi:MAG: hypothetical protein C5B50_25255 [Verrucomicrobia bacterium]|nr:MAG: hypothetical protein C5B50_25255 [Verrucomicrobiota bacterium]
MKTIENKTSKTSAAAEQPKGTLPNETPTETNALQPTLAPSEQKQLEDCEAVIASGWDNFVKVGQALATIRDQELYRQEFRTFNEYCAKKWQYSKQHAYRLIGAATTMRILSPLGYSPSPMTLAQVRPLIGLEPQDVKSAWDNAVKVADGGPVTAKLVQQAVIPFLAASGRVRPAKTPKNDSRTLSINQLGDLLIFLMEAKSSVRDADQAVRTSASTGEVTAILEKALRKLQSALELIASLHGK